jgi:hypothetical protein
MASRWIKYGSAQLAIECEMWFCIKLHEQQVSSSSTSVDDTQYK